MQKSSQLRKSAAWQQKVEHLQCMMLLQGAPQKFIAVEKSRSLLHGGQK